MGVIVECQAVMSDVECAVTRFLHGSERDGLDKILFFLAVHIVEQTVE